MGKVERKIERKPAAKPDIYYADFLVLPENKPVLDRVLLECENDSKDAQCVQALFAKMLIRRKQRQGGDGEQR